MFLVGTHVFSRRQLLDRIFEMGLSRGRLVHIREAHRILGEMILNAQVIFI